jgi:cobalamin-dependent methionine synthase I
VKFPPDVIVFDSIVFTIGTGMEEHAHFGVDFIYAKKCIKELCPYAKINDVICYFKSNPWIPWGNENS